MERKALIFALLLFSCKHGLTQDHAYSFGITAPFFSIPGVSFMLEGRVPITFGSSVAVNANWMPFSGSLGTGVFVDSQMRFYTTRKRSAPAEVPLQGFFIGPNLSLGAVGFGRIYEGNGQVAVGGVIVGNRFKIGYRVFNLEPYLSVQYGMYKRSGDYSGVYYRIIPWLSTGISLVFAK